VSAEAASLVRPLAADERMRDVDGGQVIDAAEDLDRFLGRDPER
jgi:hypothetical protein